VAKKRRTAKQKAASKRNVKKAQAKRRKSSKSRKPNKRRKSPKTVAKKKKSTPGKKSFIDKIPGLNNKTVQKVGFSLGMGLIATEAARRIPVSQVQQNAQLIGTGVSFAVDPLGGLVKLVLSPGGLNLGNLFGGNGNGNGQMQNNGGFA